MTVAAGARSSSAGNGTTKIFTAAFRANSAAEVGVALVNDTTKVATVQTITTHYTVALDADTGVPTVTFVTAPAAGVTVLIYPTNAVKQETDLDAGGSLYGTSIEAAIDKMAAQLQALEDKLGQCVRIGQGDNALAALGDGATRAGTVVTFAPTTGALTLRPLADFGL